MDQFDKTLDQLKNSSGEIKANLHILDEIIPIEEQMKYFQYSKYVNSEKRQADLDINYLIAKLFTPNVELEDKRYYLTILAGMVDVASYRAIEAYHKNPLEPELTHWSALALVESKVLLDTELSEEKQYFVSTGLGGHDGKLRFFSVIASSDFTDFTLFQKVTLIKEIKFAFNENDIELEELIDRDNYLKMTFLCDMNTDLRRIIAKAIEEGNLLGGFINEKFILTNLKKIGDADIQKMLHKSNE